MVMPEHTEKDPLVEQYKRIAGVLNDFRGTFRTQLKPSPDVFSVEGLPPEAFTLEDQEKLRALVAPDPPPPEVQERFELNNDYTAADAKQWVTELVGNALVFLRDTEGVPIPAIGDEEGWNNLLRIMTTTIAGNLLQSRAPGVLMRGDVSELGDPVYNASIQTVLDAEYEAKRLPTHLLEGQKIDAILEEQYRAGHISDPVWNAYRRSVRGRERGAIREEIAGEPSARADVLQSTVVRMLEETRQNLPATTQAALASTGSIYGHFGFATRNVIKSETPEQLASGESLFSYEVPPRQLRAGARRETDLAIFGEGQPDLTKAFQETFTGPGQLVDPSFITDPTKSKAQANIIDRVGAILKEHQKNIVAANPGISQEDLQRLMGEAAESLLEDALSSIPDEEARLRLEAISTSDGLNKARAQLLFDIGVDPASIGTYGKSLIDQVLQLARGDIDLAAQNISQEFIDNLQAGERRTQFLTGTGAEDTILEGLRSAGFLGPETLGETRDLLKTRVVPQVEDILREALRDMPFTDPGEALGTLLQGQGITPAGGLAPNIGMFSPEQQVSALAASVDPLRLPGGYLPEDTAMLRGDVSDIALGEDPSGLLRSGFTEPGYLGLARGTGTPPMPQGSMASLLRAQLDRTAYQRPDVTSEVMPALQALAGESRGFETFLAQQAPDLLRLFREGGAGGGTDYAKVRRLFEGISPTDFGGQGTKQAGLMGALVGTSQRPQVSFGDFLGSQEERLRTAFGATPTGIAEVERETQQTELERRRRLRRPGRTSLVSALA
jgi:hypothetical protein